MKRHVLRALIATRAARHVTPSPDMLFETLRQEIDILKRLRHPNIVLFMVGPLAHLTATAGETPHCYMPPSYSRTHNPPEEEHCILEDGAEAGPTYRKVFGEHLQDPFTRNSGAYASLPYPLLALHAFL